MKKKKPTTRQSGSFTDDEIERTAKAIKFLVPPPDRLGPRRDCALIVTVKWEHFTLRERRIIRSIARAALETIK
jgi:hypothetical protein